MTDENKPEENKKPTAKELKAENDAIEAELARREELESRRKMGGGTTTIPPPPEETPREYAKRIMGGK